jgi:ABC-type Zn uptake system ZnuABC Zn-binding protein ZnuA
MGRATAVGLAVLIGLGVAGCSGGADPWAERPGPKVLAYFPPVYSLAASVAGEDAQVRSLITHVGPHHFEPTARDARALRRTDLFLTIGLGLDDEIARKLAGTSGGPNLRHVALGELLPKESLREGGCEHCRKHGHDHSHDHGYDPHVWLGIAEAVRMVDAIRDALTELDPAHAEGYRARAAATVGRLNSLLAEGRAALAAKAEMPRLITFHDSLHYFARSFGAEVVDSIEAPGQEPSRKKLDELVKACRDGGVRLIAVEPQYPTHTSARTLLTELKRHGVEAAFVEIDPMETAEAADLTPDYYERTARANLMRLAGALK